MATARALVGTATLALVVACTTTYGADDPSTSGDAGPSSSSGGSSGSSTSGGSSSGSPGDGGPSGDAAGDGSTFSETCPPCSGTCVPAGCSGAGPNVTCSKPYDVTASQSLVVFACPEGPTTTLPNETACGGGGPKHGALLRLGNAPSSWHIVAQGSNPFLVTGDCSAIGAGGCSTSAVTKDFAPLLNVFVGTTKTSLASCVQISVTFEAQ